MERAVDAGGGASTPLQKFRSQARTTFCELRHSQQLCDVVIKVENEAFPCHRLILSACSPYFKALFTNELSNTESREVVITSVTAEIMQLIIDFAYELNCKITPENVEQLLPAADQFHVNGLVKNCCDFLANELNFENCIGIFKFAKAYFCHNLARKAFRYLLQNFAEVYVVSNEFQQLSLEDICTILESDELNVKNEEIVFESALRWINYDTEKRKNCIDKLLHTIRLGLLSTQYFVEKVKPHPFVKENDSCKPIVIETLKFLYDLDMDEDKEVDIHNPLARPRVPHEILFAIGGWSGGSPTNIIETYDTRADRWVVVDSIDIGPRAYHGTQCVGQKIYVIGGFDGAEYFNSVRCFDPVLKTWTEVSPMYAKRCYVSTTVLDGYIYAMGGYDGQNRQNTAEKYFPKKNQWTLIHPMNHQRSDASATTLNGKIYICGGFNGQECLSTGECYDPGTNQWTMISPMRNRRSGVSIIGYRDGVYAIGGFNGMARMNTGEKYNPGSNTWQSIPEMYNPRSNFAIQVIDDMIFAIGGFNGVTTIFHVECYDGSTDEWYDATDMSVYRSALTACVVSGLPNVQDYIHKDRAKTEADLQRKSRNCNTPSNHQERGTDRGNDENGQANGQ